MPSLKAIRKRIGSVKNTQKITKAMKMVAAAKLRRAQDHIHAFRPYAQKLERVVADLSSHFQGAADEAASRPFDWIWQKRPLRRIGLVLLTSDRGLAGAFNSNLYRRLELFLVEHPDAVFSLDIVGRKGREYVQKRLREKERPDARHWNHVTVLSERPVASAVSVVQYAKELTQSAMDRLQQNSVDAVYVLYNQFLSAGQQKIQATSWLPMEDGLPLQAFQDSSFGDHDFVYEPSQFEVLEKLLPLYVQSEMQRMLLESIASELGSRMRAMDSASKNAKEMISQLTLQFNRARQAAITKELMEIIGGSEALKG